MGFKCGIIGLPNVGKSTLFNALTNSNIKASNFLFCTIKPNIGIVSIPDLRLYKLKRIVNPKRILPTTIEFVDIAGLIEGASKGEGLGNKFLTNISNTEAICHVVRCFDNDNIIHIAGKVNPSEDINTINTELVLSDLDICECAIQRVLKKVKSGDKEAKAELAVLEKCRLQLESNGMLRSLNLNKIEKRQIRYLNFLTLKPTVYIANINEDGFKSNPYFHQVCTIAEKESSIVIPVCAVIAANISKLKYEKCDNFINKLSFKEQCLNHIIRAVYTLLNLHTYFTISSKEVHAWAVPVGVTALKAASKIHTDFEKGFIRAQTISYEDFIKYNGEQGAKRAGKMRVEGSNYIVKDGDIINFLFNV